MAFLLGRVSASVRRRKAMGSKQGGGAMGEGGNAGPTMRGGLFPGGVLISRKSCLTCSTPPPSKDERAATVMQAVP